MQPTNETSPRTLGATFKVELSNVSNGLLGSFKKFLNDEIEFANSKGNEDFAKYLTEFLENVSQSDEEALNSLKKYLSERCHITFGYLSNISGDSAKEILQEVYELLKKEYGDNKITFTSAKQVGPGPSCVELVASDFLNKLSETLLKKGKSFPDPSYFKFDAKYPKSFNRNQLDNLLDLNPRQLNDLSSQTLDNYMRRWHFNVFSKDFAQELSKNDFTITLTSMFCKALGRNVKNDLEKPL